MIDYEKIKIASEICLPTQYYFDIALGVEEGLIALFDTESSESFVDNYESIDDLIEKLRELTNPEPKYKDSYPPFDCVSLSRKDAIELRNFLDDCIARSFIDDIK